MELLLDKLGAEKIKSFSVRALTGDFLLYHGWRKALASALLKTGIGTIAAEKYMTTVSARTEEELKQGVSGLSESEKTLNGYVYSAIHDSLKGESVVRHSMAIERSGSFGDGMLSLKIPAYECRVL